MILILVFKPRGIFIEDLYIRYEIFLVVTPTDEISIQRLGLTRLLDNNKMRRWYLETDRDFDVQKDHAEHDTATSKDFPPYITLNPSTLGHLTHFIFLNGWEYACGRCSKFQRHVVKWCNSN